MSQTNEAIAPPRRRSGCLWGCLGAVLLVVLAVAGMIGFTAWSIYRSFHDDPRLQAIVQTIRADEHAKTVLGRNFFVMECERHSFPLKTGQGQVETYHLVLIGPHGESKLDARLEPAGGGMKIMTMTLTSPEGQTIRLKGETLRSPPR